MSTCRAALLCVTAVAGFGLIAGCAARHLPPPKGLTPRVNISIPSRPHSRNPPLASEILDKTLSYQLEQLLDLPHLARRLTDNPYEAGNVDEFDEVPNSSWFTHRNGRTAMSLESVKRGPTTAGPDTSDIWTVLSVKSVGVTPGMIIADGSGRRYIIKFDPVAYPELGSATEVVASRLLHAAGFNVPENFIVSFDPQRLRLDDGAELSVETNDKRRPLTRRGLAMAELHEMLGRANPNPDGSGVIRALASRFLPGIPVGPFSYTGRRGDDPNDIYAHEHRRELRGLYVVASWINHADMKEENTLDMYDPESGQITHYLIDFGASMGSNSTSPSNPRRGQANSFDLKDSLTRLATFGLYVHGYERAPQLVRYPSVGYLENDLFRPDKWKPMYPAPPFESMTDRDAFWGARIVTSFTDAQIAAAVEAGQLSDPDAAAALREFLIERRDRIGLHWFARVNPLDRFGIDGQTLSFADLAVERGYTGDPPATRYELSIRTQDGALLAADELDTAQTELQSSWQDFDHLVVSLRPRREGHRSKPVLVYVRWNAVAGGWELMGLRRLD